MVPVIRRTHRPKCERLTSPVQQDIDTQADQKPFRIVDRLFIFDSRCDAHFFATDPYSIS